jgi:ATP-dependent Clp protease ATP-binding subunit ClpA
MAAAEEARHRGDRRVGTEHLLLGLLATPGVAGLGIDLAAARAALTELDVAALRAIGLAVGAAPRSAAHPAVPATALTTGARAAINQAIRTTTRKNRSSRAPRQLLLALLAHRRPDPVAELLDHLGVDRAALQEHLEPGQHRH